MKFYIIIFVILTTPFIINAQTYEIGGFLGAANYIGDVGKTTFIAPKKTANITINFSSSARIIERVK